MAIPILRMLRFKDGKTWDTFLFGLLLFFSYFWRHFTVIETRVFEHFSTLSRPGFFLPIHDFGGTSSFAQIIVIWRGDLSENNEYASKMKHEPVVFSEKSDNSRSAPIENLCDDLWVFLELKKKFNLNRQSFSTFFSQKYDVSIKKKKS